ncbi:hypothetical protein BC828DRAFT_77014 [Blastocladiella britannica]|nr:hypothetical protein BC828DRAFT_77014 [Blastocladiella britannica]
MIPASAPPSPMSAPRHLGDDSSTSMPSSPTVGASTTATSSRQTLRIRRGHRGNYAPLPDGLLKRTLSVPTTSGLVFHVVQYISEDVNNGHSDGTLLVPSDDPWLAQRGARLTSVPWDAYPHLDSSQVLAKLAGPVADSPQSDAPITEWPASASGPVQMPLAGGGAGRVRSASASSARTYGGSASGVPAVSGSFSISPPEAARQLSSSAPHFPSPLRPSFFAGPSSAFAAASAGNYSDDRRMQFPPPLPTPTSASFLQHHPSQYQYQYQQQQYQHQHYHSAPASSPLAPPMPPPDVPRTARAVPPRRSSDLPMMPEPQAMPSHWQLAPAPRRASVSPWSNGMPTVVHGTSAPRSPLRLQQQQQQQQYQHQLPHPFPGPMPAPNTASSSAATTTAYLAAPVSLARTARMASAPYPTPRSTEFPPPTPRRTPSYSSSPMALSPTMHHQQQPPLMGMPSSIGMGPAMPLEPPTTAATSMTTSPLSSPSMPPSSSRHILSSLTGGAAASAWSSFAARSALAPRPLGPSFARSTEALPRLWCPSNGEPAPREIMSSRSAGLGLEQARVYVPIVSSSSMAPPPPPTPLEPLYPLATSHGPVRPMAAAAASIGGMGVDHRGDGGADSGAHEAMDWAAPKDFPPPV